MAGQIPVEAVVEASETTVELCPNRPSRRSVVIFNNGTENLYIRYGNGASLDDWIVYVEPGWYGRMPWGEVYTGIITGVWGAGATGDAHVTELIH